MMYGTVTKFVPITPESDEAIAVDIRIDFNVAHEPIACAVRLPDGALLLGGQPWLLARMTQTRYAMIEQDCLGAALS